VSRFLDVLRSETQEALDRPVLALLLLLVFVSFAFVALPDLDLWVSSLFYDPASGFLDRRTGLVDTVRGAGRAAEWTLAIAVTAPLFLRLLVSNFRLLVRPRETVFVLSSYVVGPGLIVNGILKDHWGRARPRQLVEFGGSEHFSPVWAISDACQRNCSFVSGEGASAFWLLAIVFLVPRELRWRVGIVTFVFAAAVSLARIAAGGHFLSDVLIAWLLVFLVLLLTHRLCLGVIPPAFDPATEGAFEKGGRALRRKLKAWRGN
jgi:membrane-associated PAP2 superfamily phosphatase